MSGGGGGGGGGGGPPQTSMLPLDRIVSDIVAMGFSHGQARACKCDGSPLTLRSGVLCFGVM